MFWVASGSEEEVSSNSFFNHLIMFSIIWSKERIWVKLVEINIENFRGIRSLLLPLDELTVLIGENNVGKSTVLEAIRLVIARGFGSRRTGQFSEYDFNLADENSTPQTAQPIKITLHFAEEKENEWADAIVQQMDDVIKLDPNGLKRNCTFDQMLLVVHG